MCDLCGKAYVYDDALHEISGHWWGLWRGRKDGFVPDYCHECAPKNEGLVYALRDIAELKTFVNKLERAINEKRKQGTQNNRTTASDAGECSERGDEWRSGYRAGYRAAQVGKEHQREPVQRNEDSHVQP